MMRYPIFQGTVRMDDSGKFPLLNQLWGRALGS